MDDQDIPKFESIPSACDQCGRSFGREMLSCPDRAFDRCPYAKQNLHPIHNRLFFWGLTVLSIIWLIFWTRQEIRYPGFALCIGEFIGLAILFVGFQGALITISQLYNPRSKLLWTRTSVFGVPLVRTILTSGRRLQMELSWNNRPEIPISVVEYFKVTTWQAGSMTQAVQVFQSVIIELLARGVIQVYQYQHYTSRGWGKFKPVGSVYIFLPMQ